MGIKKSKELCSVLGEPNEVALSKRIFLPLHIQHRFSSFSTENGGTCLSSPVYNLLAVDLRKPPSVSLEPALVGGSTPLVDPTLPALILFECVLAYMQPSESSAIVSWFTDRFRGSAPLGGIVYEMFGLNDPFGRVMKNNLKVAYTLMHNSSVYSLVSSHRFVILNSLEQSRILRTKRCQGGLPHTVSSSRRHLL